jgi:heme-degrading monooxygenase HmoA
MSRALCPTLSPQVRSRAKQAELPQLTMSSATVVRVWRTEIDTDRAGEYDEFVRTKSMPMFQRQAGFVAALFCGQASSRVVITLWRGRAAVDALRTSETYRETVSEIEAAGFLQGSQTTDIFDLDAHSVRE